MTEGEKTEADIKYEADLADALANPQIAQLKFFSAIVQGELACVAAAREIFIGIRETHGLSRRCNTAMEQFEESAAGLCPMLATAKSQIDTQLAGLLPQRKDYEPAPPIAPAPPADPAPPVAETAEPPAPAAETAPVSSAADSGVATSGPANG